MKLDAGEKELLENARPSAERRGNAPAMCDRAQTVWPAPSTSGRMSIPASSQASAVPEPYSQLYRYLNGRFADTIVLTFEQIEMLLGSALPDLARLRTDWWASAIQGAAHSMQASSWTQAGMTATPNLSARSVMFNRQTG